MRVRSQSRGFPLRREPPAAPRFVALIFNIVNLHFELPVSCLAPLLSCSLGFAF
jgi:hypothetical protein